MNLSPAILREAARQLTDTTAWAPSLTVDLMHAAADLLRAVADRDDAHLSKLSKHPKWQATIDALLSTEDTP